MAVPVQSRPLVARARWLIRLRWLAIFGVIAAAVCARRIFGVGIRLDAICYVAAVMILYNYAFLFALKRIEMVRGDETNGIVKLLIDIQIALDLVALTGLLHFSGGIENPFVLYFVFHMVIASILLSVRESYLHATLAISLFCLLVLLEARGILPHYCLRGEGSGHLRSDGVYIFGSLFAFGTTLYLVVYMTSFITLRLRQQEQAYREANIQLEQKDRVKDEYVERVTHDIKGHLAAIQSCLAVLTDKLVGPLNERQSEFLNRAHGRTRTLTTFVKTLLRLTQMRLSDNLEEDVFVLKDAIGNAIESVVARAADKSIELKLDIESSSGAIFGNQFSIEEMLTNLLLNSIKYTPDSGSIEVNLMEQGSNLLVEISDTGIGIPESEIGKVFDEFYRASNAKEVDRDGTGLGLSIVKQIVERHGGRISVASTEGEGSTFKMVLPMAEQGR